MKRSKTIRDYLDRIKLEKGCIDCGYNASAVALDFDHVRGEKLFDLSRARNIAQADDEIAKCDVRCSNCHRIVTAERSRAKAEMSRRQNARLFCEAIL